MTDSKSADAKSTGTAGAKGFQRRDLLRSLESGAQQYWEDNKVFEKDAGEEGEPKFYTTFPYPYMNGTLHLGHAFSYTRAEFAVAYEAMKGKKALFPLAFHCTGMPIKACADKLKREIETFGCPPDFSKAEEVTPEATTTTTAEFDPSKQKFGKKAKIQSKSTGKKYQWQIMQAMGIPEAEIPKFADAAHWLEHFPPIAQRDLKAMGAHVDWRRSFITTDVNPYYDQFVRWQFLSLKKGGFLDFGKRYDIFSPLDNQPCADHDRATGEGVKTQEYTIIKMEVVAPFPEKLKQFENSGKKVFFACATLRPETMYGQTNCWILPDGQYGAFEINDTEIFVCTPRAARNMAYQFLSKEERKVSCVAELSGWDLLGCPVKAPLSAYPVVYTLPMLTVSCEKGTGVVTCVPSDSPDDFAALTDLQKKEPMRRKFGLKDEWVLPFKAVPIIEIPEFGNLTAPTLYEQLKITSQNDRDKLLIAKEKAYTKGFYEGVMLVGEHKGMKVADAKKLTRDAMLASGEAVVYCEPEAPVMSRSGDECVVCLADQWYLNYGEEEWKKKGEKCLEGMRTYHDETRNAFKGALDWIHQWACSRTYGLGTRLPWDEQYLIESLSDSTIYMAFYTIAHLLQGGEMYGQTQGPAKIPAEKLTPEVFDYIFLDTTYESAHTDIPQDVLDALRKEFRFWYPVDLRVSGKDLVPNHLTFYIYNHTAIFPEKHWPKGIRANGHVLINNEKMAKSTGNFLSLEDAIAKYSADAMRFALADAGDGLDDANFVDDTANSAILRLTNFLTFVKETLAETAGRKGPASTFHDKVFEAHMNKSIQAADAAYDEMLYREVLKCGFFDLQSARDAYRLSCGEEGMNLDLLNRFCEVQTLILAPITPHLCEHIWRDLLSKDGSVTQARFPVADAVDEMLIDQAAFLDDVVRATRLKILALLNPKKGKKGKAPEPIKASKATFTVARHYPAWQHSSLKVMNEVYNPTTKTFPGAKEIMALLKEIPEVKPNMKKVMPFVMFVQQEVTRIGPKAMALENPVDEYELLTENVEYLKRLLQLDAVAVKKVEDEGVSEEIRGAACPSKPSITLE
eukprot:GCRY01000655.1.p1 GENE.GCRY01000655.1~~GCRY01000655.1.p1  ORF type:complete len:1099 (-),score=454.66 GCRY01000655.1:972-4202(-)